MYLFYLFFIFHFPFQLVFFRFLINPLSMDLVGNFLALHKGYELIPQPDSTVSPSAVSLKPTLSLPPPRSTSPASQSPNQSTTPTSPKPRLPNRQRRANSSVRVRRRRFSQRRRSLSRRWVSRSMGQGRAAISSQTIVIS